MKKKMVICELAILFFLLTVLFCSLVNDDTVYRVGENEETLILYVNGEEHIYQDAGRRIKIETPRHKIQLVLPCGDSIHDAWDLEYPPGVSLVHSKIFLDEVSVNGENKVMYMQELHLQQLALAEEEMILLTKEHVDGMNSEIVVQFRVK